MNRDKSILFKDLGPLNLLHICHGEQGACHFPHPGCLVMVIKPITGLVTDVTPLHCSHTLCKWQLLYTHCQSTDLYLITEYHRSVIYFLDWILFNSKSNQLAKPRLKASSTGYIWKGLLSHLSLVTKYKTSCSFSPWIVLGIDVK